MKELSDKDLLLLTPMQETIEQVKATLRQHFEVVDWQGLDIVMACAAAHYLPGEPLWVRLVGPSGCGKTELLRAIARSPDATEMGAITPASLRGGYKPGHKLLARINGKLVISLDAAALWTLRREAKTEVFGLLRHVKDGSLVADFGSDEGHVVQQARFTWLLGTTPYVEQQRVLEALLGERFIDIRWVPGDREQMALKAQSNKPLLETAIRPALAADVVSLLSRAREEAPSAALLAEKEMKWVAKLADFVARLRTPVLTDERHQVHSIPTPEVGTRLAQDFNRVAQGLRLLGLADWQAHIRRLAWDCIPSLRSAIVRSLTEGSLTVSDIAASLRLPKTTVTYQVEEMEALGVAAEDVYDCKSLLVEVP